MVRNGSSSNIHYENFRFDRAKAFSGKIEFLKSILRAEQLDRQLEPSAFSPTYLEDVEVIRKLKFAMFLAATAAVRRSSRYMRFRVRRAIVASCRRGSVAGDAASKLSIIKFSQRDFVRSRLHPRQAPFVSRNARENSIQVPASLGEISVAVHERLMALYIIDN